MTKKVKKHHWIGITPEPEKFLGFIYLITNNVTGVKYVGRKNYWIKKQLKGCKSMPTTDRQSPAWKTKCFRESSWSSYKGSSKHLTKDIKKHGVEAFEFRIIKQCRSKGTLHYSEVEAMVKLGAMTELSDTSDDGYLFHNRTIPRIRFRVPAIYQEEEKLKIL